MSTQDNGPLTATAEERAHPAYAKLARACITLARLSRQHGEPPESEVERTTDGAAR